tara:strand:+ start:433 stop:624 length:192 start_codon:yes stop_codon:yes gene_type:complete
MLAQRNFGVTICIVIGLIANQLIQQIGMMVYPSPSDLNTNDIDALLTYDEFNLRLDCEHTVDW